MNYAAAHILWISPDESQVQNDLFYLEECGHPVSHVSDAIQWQTEIDKKIPEIIIVSHQKNAEQGIAVCQGVQSMKSAGSLFCILITEEITVKQKETYFSSGGNELIISPFAHEELRSKFKPYLSRKNEIASLSSQLDESSQMALMAMETSSDLGGIINFVKGAITSTNYTELAQHMFEATSLYSDSSFVEIKGHHAYEYFCSKGTIDPDMKRLLDSNKSSKRVMQLNDITQINQTHLTYLVEGLPVDDTAKMGRISDSMVMLCDIADRFVQALAIEENIKKSDESRRRFLSTLSHELRTPLNSILGFSKALVSKKEDKPIGGNGLDALKRIIDNTEQINAIIRTLLEISSASPNNTDAPTVEVDRLLLRLRNDYTKKAKEKNLEFNFSACEGLSFQSDESKVLAMLVHLMDNALKYTDTGHITLTAGKEEDDSFGSYIYFDVSDTGIGIDEINHKRIFSEIGQLNTKHDRRHYGIGLGLYYVDQVSQQLGGTVSVQSKLNEGSTFRLSLPTNLSNAQQESEDEITLF